MILFYFKFLLEFSQKSIKVKREKFKIHKNKKLTKRSTQYKLSNNSTELSRLKKDVKMMKSEFILINCDYIDSVSYLKR